MSGIVRSGDTPLSPKQMQALPHLSIGKTLAHTATAINVSERTLYRWLTEPVFKNAYQELREMEFEIAKAELRGLSLKAARTLSKAMDSSDPYINLRAAQTSVNASIKVEGDEDAKRIIRIITQIAKQEDDTVDPRMANQLHNQLQKLSEDD